MDFWPILWSMAAIHKLTKGWYLFREGDPPDAMYVVKVRKNRSHKIKTNWWRNHSCRNRPRTAMVGEMAFLITNLVLLTLKLLKIVNWSRFPTNPFIGNFNNFLNGAKPSWEQSMIIYVMQINELNPWNAMMIKTCFLPFSSINWCRF